MYSVQIKDLQTAPHKLPLKFKEVGNVYMTRVSLIFKAEISLLLI